MKAFLLRHLSKISWEARTNPVSVVVTLLLLAFLIYKIGPEPVLTLALFFAVVWGNLTWMLAFMSAFRDRAAPSVFDVFCFVAGTASIGASFQYGYGAVGSMTWAIPAIFIAAYLLDGWVRNAWRRLWRAGPRKGRPD